MVLRVPHMRRRTLRQRGDPLAELWPKSAKHSPGWKPCFAMLHDDERKMNSR
jgi:hypothetical protein